MFFSSQTRNSKVTAEPPSKRSKISGPIYCLFPAEVEKAALEVCAVQRNAVKNMFIETINEKREFFKSDLRPKNQLVEKIVEENIGPIVEAISDEISISVREILTSKIHDYIEKGPDNYFNKSDLILKSEIYSGQESMLYAGEVAQKKRLFKNYQVRAQIRF